MKCHHASLKVILHGDVKVQLCSHVEGIGGWILSGDCNTSGGAYDIVELYDLQADRCGGYEKYRTTQNQWRNECKLNS